MRRLLAIVFFLLLLPVFSLQAQYSDAGKSYTSSYGNTVVFAGHTVVGHWCECGSSVACICDPGETPGGLRVQQPAQDVATSKGEQTTDTGMIGVVALLLVTASFFWLQLRN